MFTNFFIFTLTVSGATILWRTLKDDHPKFKEFIRSLPFVGSALSCGVCISYWFSLPALFIADVFPFSNIVVPNSFALFTPVVLFFIQWFALGTSVLFTRSLVIVLLETSAILKHYHIASHK